MKNILKWNRFSLRRWLCLSDHGHAVATIVLWSVCRVQYNLHTSLEKPLKNFDHIKIQSVTIIQISANNREVYNSTLVGS